MSVRVMLLVPPCLMVRLAWLVWSDVRVWQDLAGDPAARPRDSGNQRGAHARQLARERAHGTGRSRGVAAGAPALTMTWPGSVGGLAHATHPQQELLSNVLRATVMHGLVLPNNERKVRDALAKLLRCHPTRLAN